MSRHEGPDIPVSPVSGWLLSPVPQYDAVILSLDYLSGTSAADQTASKSPVYTLTAAQARELIAALERGIGAIDSYNATQGGAKVS